MDELNELDIDYSLYKYWIFYRFDINNKRVNNKIIFKQKLKLYIMILLCLINIFRFSMCLYVSKSNKEVAWYYFDSFQYIGVNKEFVYIGVLFSLILATLLLIIMNFSPKNNYKWYEIIDAINGYITFQSIGLCDRYLIEKFKRNVFYLNLLIKSQINFIIFVTFITSVIIFYTKFFKFNLIVQGAINCIFIMIQTYICAPIICYVFQYYLIICYFLKYWINSYNKTLIEIQTSDSRIFFKRKLNSRIVVNHNKLCLNIEVYNQFWKNISFAFIHIIIPMNAYDLNLVLFNKFNIVYRIGYSFILSSLLLLFLLNYITSDINKGISKTYKYLNNCFRNNNISKYKLFKFKV